MRISDWSSDLCSSDLLRQYLADTASVHPGREFFLLWALGQDLPGAITVVNEGNQAWPNDFGMDPADDASSTAAEHALRFSLAGVQLKFSAVRRSEEHTSELQSLMRNSYAVFCLKKKKNTKS